MTRIWITTFIFIFSLEFYFLVETWLSSIQWIFYILFLQTESQNNIEESTKTKWIYVDGICQLKFNNIKKPLNRFLIQNLTSFALISTKTRIWWNCGTNLSHDLQLMEPGWILNNWWLLNCLILIIYVVFFVITFYVTSFLICNIYAISIDKYWSSIQAFFCF